MLFVVTWMQVGIIILNDVSQKEKDKYHMISLIQRILKNELIDTKKRLAIDRDGELMGG